MKSLLLTTLNLGLLVSGVRAADSPQARAEQLLRDKAGIARLVDEARVLAGVEGSAGSIPAMVRRRRKSGSARASMAARLPRWPLAPTRFSTMKF